MFENIGAKLKTVAEILAIAGIVINVIIGILMFFEANFLGGIIAALVGSFLSLAGGYALYGLGTLVENSEVITDYCEWKYRQETKKDPEE